MSNPVLPPPPLRNYFITELQIFISGNGPEEFQQCSVPWLCLRGSLLVVLRVHLYQKDSTTYKANALILVISLQP